MSSLILKRNNIITNRFRIINNSLYKHNRLCSSSKSSSSSIPPQQTPSKSSSSSSSYIRVGILFSLAIIGGYLIPFEDHLFMNTKKKDKDPFTELQEPQGTITNRVFFDISIDKNEPRRLIIGLYGNDCPKTVKNFIELTKGTTKSNDGKLLAYKGSKFHRIIRGFMIQGGDFENGNGMGGQAIYGRRFEDENFKFKHKGLGVVSMANSGPNSNGSQFFICFTKANWLDGKHIVFGQVIHGDNILDDCEDVGSRGGTPSKEVVIVNCGVIDGEKGYISNEKEILDTDGRALDRIMK